MTKCRCAGVSEVLLFSFVAFLLMFGGSMVVDSAQPSFNERMIYLGSTSFSLGLFTLCILGSKHMHRKIRVLEERLKAIEDSRK
jgi:hypothetical protein